MATRSAANARSVPSSASVDMAAVMSAILRRPREVVEGQQQHPEHAVRAVDQREALLGGQGERLDRRGGQRLARRHALARRRPDLALADQRQAAVSERSQVAARAERAVLGDHGVEPCRKQRKHRLRHDRTRARAAHGQRARAQEHHRAHGLALDGRAHAGRVRADQRALKLLAPLRRDPGAGERAEPGRDAVDRLVRAGQALHHRRALLHGGPRLVRQPRRNSVAGDGDNIGRLDPVAGQLDRRRLHHGHSITSPRAGSRAQRSSAQARGRNELGGHSRNRLKRAPARSAGSARRTRTRELFMNLPGRQAAGEEAREHTLLRGGKAVNHDRCGAPSHDLRVLFPALRSCKPRGRL